MPAGGREDPACLAFALFTGLGWVELAGGLASEVAHSTGDVIDVLLPVLTFPEVLCSPIISLPLLVEDIAPISDLSTKHARRPLCS